MIDFANAVIERSFTLPVVVDFWASWCAPCRTLGPVIEELAAQAAGRWELVKLDTEAQPDIAQQFAVMSIPAVKMFHQGQVVAEFVGALPAEQIRQWLDEHLPDDRLDPLASLVARWEAEGGEAIAPELEAFVEQHPELHQGRLRLAQAIVAGNPGRARELISGMELDADLAELASDILGLADLMDSSAEPPPRLAPQLDGARQALRRHDLDGALQHLVEMAMIDKSFDNELARRAAVALFRLLGEDHELQDKHRRRLSMALHS